VGRRDGGGKREDDGFRFCSFNNFDLTRFNYIVYVFQPIILFPKKVRKQIQKRKVIKTKFRLLRKSSSQNCNAKRLQQ